MNQKNRKKINYTHRKRQVSNEQVREAAARCEDEPISVEEENEKGYHFTRYFKGEKQLKERMKSEFKGAF